MEIQRTNNTTEKTQSRQRLTNKTRAALLAEQETLVERLSEVTAILSGKASTKSVQHTPRTWPEDFNIQAYAIGIIWKKHDIGVTELANQLGVSRSTIYSPQWSDVARLLAGRKNETPPSGRTNSE